MGHVLGVFQKTKKKVKKKKTIDIYFFFHCITKERASVQIHANCGY